MSHTVTVEQYESLIQAALQARDGSYSPYSKFRVGAALLTAEGETIKGANVENASYGGTICAERSALCKAVTDGKKNFLAIAVAADVPSASVSPCGICRQFIREFCPLTTPIVMVSSTYQTGDYTNDQQAVNEKNKTTVTMTLEQLLPMSFGPDELKMGQRS
ncbi:cytidine deaminase [Phaffia rhodozyma]|uniref:Cytidine deaminase n=1 Tax=Phaffia rhodozyma TaxID=264483 RepID=A0A0F7SVY5_PHARH|nr:cytidine deaminase [Phaffia rhodozyma]